MYYIGCRFGSTYLFITNTKGRSTLWQQVCTNIHYSAISVKETLKELWIIGTKTDSTVVAKQEFYVFKQFCHYTGTSQIWNAFFLPSASMLIFQKLKNRTFWFTDSKTVFLVHSEKIHGNKSIRRTKCVCIKIYMILLKII